MPQWLLAARCEVVAANLRKIEQGITQPSITLAVRLLIAVGTDVGPHMASLAHEVFTTSASEDPVGGTGCDGNIALTDAFRATLLQGGHNNDCAKHMFGPLLKEARTFYGVSQKKLAEGASYHLRNMLEVESGRRDPSVMTALSMVHSIGCDVGTFFTIFARLVETRMVIR